MALGEPRPESVTPSRRTLRGSGSSACSSDRACRLDRRPIAHGRSEAARPGDLGEVAELQLQRHRAPDRPLTGDPLHERIEHWLQSRLHCRPLDQVDLEGSLGADRLAHPIRANRTVINPMGGTMVVAGA